MALKRQDNSDRELRNECERLLNYHVKFIMNDGSQLDGIIDEVNDEGVVILVGEDVMENELNPQRKYRQPRRFRRFRRRFFPFRSLATLYLLSYPFFAPPFFI